MNELMKNLTEKREIKKFFLLYRKMLECNEKKNILLQLIAILFINEIMNLIMKKLYN